MLNNSRAKWAGCLIWDGCSCHNSKRLRRKVKHSYKQAEKRAWKRENATLTR